MRTHEATTTKLSSIEIEAMLALDRIEVRAETKRAREDTKRHTRTTLKMHRVVVKTP